MASKTEQQSITDDDAYSFTLATDDVEHLAAALEPFTNTLVCLEVDHDRLEVSAADMVDVLATRVSFDADAPHARTLTINTDAFVEAVDELWWQDDRVRLEVSSNEDDDELWIFDGEEMRTGFQTITLQDSDDARSPPSIDNLLEETTFDAIAECEAWELAGAMWTVAQPADSNIRLTPAGLGILAEGDSISFHDDGDLTREWPYGDGLPATFDHRNDDAESGGECHLDAGYICSIADALPLEGSVEICFGDLKPLFIRSETGVEFALAPRRKDAWGDGDE